MAKWKYQNPDKQKMYTDYKSGRLYIEEGKKTKLVLSDWEFLKSGGSTPTFKCFVIEENGQEVDKHWSVWDFDLKEALKAKLRGKKPKTDKIAVTIKKIVKGMEESYELK